MKIVKILVPIVLFLFLITFGISKYNEGKKEKKLTYHTMHESKGGVMIIGGSADDKTKIDAFKDSLEEDDSYWDNLHISSDYRRKGDINNAIIYTKKALEVARSKGDQFQARMGLARLYGMNKQYDLAIEEYKWCIDYSNRPDVIEKLQAEINAIKKLQVEAF